MKEESKSKTMAKKSNIYSQIKSDVDDLKKSKMVT